MARLMSVSHTTDAVRERRKTVTRRIGWWQDKNGRRLIHAGDRLTLCEKVMGRAPGQPVQRLAEARVIGVRRELLWDITDLDIEREAVPTLHPDGSHVFEEWYEDTGLPSVTAWVTWFCESMGCRPDTEITRIRFRYLDNDICSCSHRIGWHRNDPASGRLTCSECGCDDPDPHADPRLRDAQMAGAR